VLELVSMPSTRMRIVIVSGYGRSGLRRRNRTLRPAKRQEGALVTAGGYAASDWNGVACGSISEAKPRSQLTKTWPRSSIWSTTPRSPAHRPESSPASLTNSILAPIATPARIRAARSLAPLASMMGLSVSSCASFTLNRRVTSAGDVGAPAKSRLAGGLLRTRRLRIGPPASSGTRERRR